MAMDMELCITGPGPGKIDHTLYCHVMNLEEPLHLQVQAEFKVLLTLYALMESTFYFDIINLGWSISGAVVPKLQHIPSLTGVTALWYLSKTIYPSLVLVQPRKTRPFITERLLIGRKESNQTNKQNKQQHIPRNRYLESPSCFLSKKR